MKRAPVIALLGTASLVFGGVPEVLGLDVVDAFSPHNKNRAKRARTEVIVLHTTEGSAIGALAKLRKYGEANYLVDTKGKVYHIIEHGRVSHHAGVSMWNKRSGLNNYSVGIEVAGYHNRPVTAAQLKALKELIAKLQSIYGVPDDRVLSHSMVAYGRPNRWFSKPHRGRKRCGMQFADPTVRRKLGLTSKPSRDPDVKAGRLIVGDKYLAQVLYGRGYSGEGSSAIPGSNVITRGRNPWHIARELYDHRETVYTFPDGKVKRGDQITDWRRIPNGTRIAVAETAHLPESDADDALPGPPMLAAKSLEPEKKTAPKSTIPAKAGKEPAQAAGGAKLAGKPGADAFKGAPAKPAEGILVLGRDGKSAKELAGDAYNTASCIYFLPGGQVRQGNELKKKEIEELPEKTRILVGYVNGGHLGRGRYPYMVCGERWNDSATYYRFPDGALKPGNTISARALPDRAMLFFPM